MSEKVESEGAPIELGPGIQRIRIDGPDKFEDETQLAAIVESALRHLDGRELGPRFRRDGKDGLDVDFTYDQATPRVALEITAIHDPRLRQLNSELKRLEADLSAVVERESLGQWWIGIVEGSRRGDLTEPMIAFLRSKRDVPGVVRVDQSGDHHGDPEDAEALAELFALGVYAMARFGTRSEVFVFPPLRVDHSARPNFEPELTGAIAQNAAKLEAARPRETHLVVCHDRSDLSADPLATPPPELPDAIDVLWVTFGYYQAKYTHRLWRTRRGSGEWELLHQPWGEPNRIVRP